jgi:hypothetical protein
MAEEKKPKSGLKIFFIILLTFFATIFVLALILFSWLWIKNPLNVRAIILYKIGLKEIEAPAIVVPPQDATSPASAQPSTPTTNQGVPVSDLPISETQRDALESAGIDPNAIQITPEMEACFIEKLGDERVQEIINGATPGPLEIFKASSCL